MRRALCALCALCLFAMFPVPALAQGKFPLGFGSGSFAPTAGTEDTVKPWSFEHAIAYAAFDGDDRSTPVTVVLVSSAAIDEAKARDDEYLAAEAKAGRLKAVQVRLSDANGRVLQHAAFDERGRTALEAPEKATFTKYAFFFTRVEGQVHFFPKPDSATPIQRGYMLIFNARVRQGAWREPGEASGTVRLGARSFDVRHAAMIEEKAAATAAAAAGKGFAVLWATVANGRGGRREGLRRPVGHRGQRRQGGRVDVRGSGSPGGGRRGGRPRLAAGGLAHGAHAGRAGVGQARG